MLAVSYEGEYAESFWQDVAFTDCFIKFSVITEILLGYQAPQVDRYLIRVLSILYRFCILLPILS